MEKNIQVGEEVIILSTVWRNNGNSYIGALGILHSLETAKNWAVVRVYSHHHKYSETVVVSKYIIPTPLIKALL